MVRTASPSTPLPSPMRIEPRPLVLEMSDSYLDYAMSVIVSRALPDARDGLKPVHRRILYAMWTMGLRAGAKFRKSATVVGEVLGKYHPHGDVAVYDALVRMAQDFSMREPLVRGQGNFGCFTKETKIKLTDGRDLSFEDLVKEYEAGKRNYTYTVNTLGFISIAEIRHPRKTRKKAELVRVTLDNGVSVRCTPNHLFMVRSGLYKEASALTHGESLMPLYQKVSTTQDRLARAGYILVYQNKKDAWVPAHHLADNYNLTRGAYQKSAGRVRHHIDFNKLNNNPENIRRVGWKEHFNIHALHASHLHRDAAYREKIAQGRKSFWGDAANREKYAERLSRRNRSNWQESTYREKMREFLSRVNKEYIKKHPEVREELAKRGSRTLKRLWQEEKYRAIFHEKIVAANKRRITNNTGKVKFLRVCREVLQKNSVVSPELYEKVRAAVYPYGMATTWDTGLKRYYQSDTNLLLHELNRNHKVVSVEWVPEREDVYDLTIDGSHNFALACGVFVHNSMDGDAAAAMRYTEAKLTPLAEELLFDIEKETVPFVPNYDGTQQEPSVFPAKLPNLLLNGTVGIAVGMATNIPPHNASELCDGVIHLIVHPDATVEDLMQYIKGPDFPTGGIIYSIKDIQSTYATGRGAIVMRARTDIHEHGDHHDIIVTEMPYQVNKATVLEKIAELVKEKRIEGIKDLRDESNKEGVRVVVELKRDAYPRKVLNQLFEYTQLQETFHVNSVALVDGIQPRVLTLKMLLEEFVKHRREVVVRRTTFDFARAKERAHILEGLVMALEDIDRIIATIKKSKDRDDAKTNLMQKFRLSERQAIAILEMRLQQLANLERLKVEEELKEKKRFMKECEELLGSPKKILGVVRDELVALKTAYATPRRTEIVARGVGKFTEEDLIPNEGTIVMITRDGYLKRLPPETFKIQGRGGKGVIGLTTKEEDSVEHLFGTTTHSDLLFFTTRGRIFQLKAYEVPQASRTAKGQAIVNFLELGPGEKVSSVLSLSELSGVKYLVMQTRNGVIKKVEIAAFMNVRRSGLIAIRLRENDELAWVKPSTGKNEIMLVTHHGQAIRFAESDVRPMGRVARGVRGIRLKKGDAVVGMDVVTTTTTSHGKQQLLVVMENGFGKRTGLSQYKVQHRGGSGIKTAKVTGKTGALVTGMVVAPEGLPEVSKGDLLIVSAKGQVIRIALKGVSVLGRATQGVRIMRFKESGDKVASVALV